MGRSRLWLINVIVPGGGLIVLRREWLGVALAGWLLMPAVIPPLLTWVSAGGATAVWGWAQWLAWARWRSLGDGTVERAVLLLLEGAQSALERGAGEEARGLLRAALRLDDEDVRVLRVWARVVKSESGVTAEARVWRQILRVSPAGQARAEAEAALGVLRGGGVRRRMRE